MKVEDKYQPRSLDEIIFPDVTTKTLIGAYADRRFDQHLLLWGPNGTGKTGLADLLPIAIDGPNAYVEDKDLDELLRMKDLKDYLQRQCALAQMTYSSKYYVVLHEFDDAKHNLPTFWKAVDKCGDAMLLILTTNNPMGIHKSIRSRCQILEMPAVSVQQVLSRCEMILKIEGVPISRAALDRELRATNADGDLRKYFRTLDRIISTTPKTAPPSALPPRSKALKIQK